MRRVSFVGRTLAVTGLILGLVAVFATTRVAAQADEVDLIIHVLTCPTDAKGDIFEACHDNRVEGAEFTIEGVETDEDEPIKSDEEGVIEVTVEAGELDIEAIDFEDIATAGRAIVYCSPQGGKPLTEYKTTDGKITIEIDEDDEEVHCDWYNRTGEPEPEPTATDEPDPTAEPGTADLIWIHALECPIDATGDIFEACHDNRLEGVQYDIDGTIVTSDEDGVASLENPPSGEISIRQLDFAEIATAGEAFVHCSVQPGGSPVLTSRVDRDGEIFIDVPENSEVHCDWYNRTGEPDPTATATATEDPDATSTPTRTPTRTPTEDDGGNGGGSATETAEAEGTTTLPDTGAGPTDGSSSGAGFAFGLGLIVLAIGGLAYGLRRRPATTTRS